MLGINLLSTLINPHLDRLGDINPQLLRELKGRLKRLPVITAIVLSILCQIAVMIGFWVALPGPVTLEDTRLSTYPKIEWRSETQLNPKPMKDLLPMDMAYRNRAATTGIVVDSIDTPETVRGDKSLGLNALNTIKVNDRLIKIDSQLFTPNSEQLEIFDWHYNYALSSDHPIFKHSYESLTPRLQKLIGTTVSLELYNNRRGYYTVTLPYVALIERNSQYCVFNKTLPRRYCNITPDKQSYQVNWSKWYGDIYICLSSLIILPLTGLGIFMLANNLAEEKRRGTLNFLQLSPKSAFTILSGKLLGVPICLYLAVGLLFPLHWAIGLHAGYNIAHLLGFYLILISQTLIFYLATLLLSLSVSNSMILGLQPWLLAAGVVLFNLITLLYAGSGEFVRNTQSNILWWSILFSPFSSLAYFTFEQMTTTPNVNLALGNFRINFTEYVTLTLVHAISWYALLGHGLKRRFSNAEITLLKRRFSYPLTLIFATFMVGLTGTRVASSEDMSLHLFLITLLSLVYCVLLMLALSPTRQTLKDWTRFRHTKLRHERLSLWEDLMIGDTSSPVIAIALNLLLLTSILLIAFVSHYGDFLINRREIFIFACCILMFVGSIMFSTIVSQTLLMLPRKKNWIWLGAVSSISCLAFPSLSLIMGVLLLVPSHAPTHILGLSSQLAVFALPLSLLGTLTTVLTFIHTQQLIYSGHSESKKLLSQSVTQ